MLLGAHQSVAGGLHLAFGRGAGDGCKAIQIFTKNSNMWREPALTDDAVRLFKEAHAAFGGGKVLAHTSYLINLATDKPDILKKSVDALVAEIDRSSALGVAYVVLHPGAHLGFGEDGGITRVAEALDEVHERTQGKTAQILLENTAGQGTCVGHMFEHLGAILERTRERERLGVCFDTQHAFAAGYDVSTADGYEKTWEAFERTVGVAHLRAFHLNDSKKALGSRVDRHEHIGDGNLGLPMFWRLLNDPRFRDIPAVLETEPEEGERPHAREVALIHSLVGGKEPQPKASPFALELTPPAPPKRKTKEPKGRP
jgi:deoxyribonuclease-4